MKNVNGFIFNDIGDLIEQPEAPSIDLLHETRRQLVQEGEFISASRIDHLLRAAGDVYPVEKPFVVTWDIELDAFDHVDAAKRALQMIIDTGSIAHVFNVKEVGSNWTQTIDLDAELDDDTRRQMVPWLETQGFRIWNEDGKGWTWVSDIETNGAYDNDEFFDDVADAVEDLLAEYEYLREDWADRDTK